MEENSGKMNLDEHQKRKNHVRMRVVHNRSMIPGITRSAGDGLDERLLPFLDAVAEVLVADYEDHASFLSNQ
ncbi:MAG: hypothetical protein ABW146_13795 [Candidatus Sedimenticola sp. 6PFRAG7]